MKFITILFAFLFTAISLRAGDVPQKTSPNWPSSYPISGSVTIVNSSFTYFKSVSVSTTPVQVKSGATEIWGFYSYNNATAGNERSIKLYNRATTPTVGTTQSDLTFTFGGRSGLYLPLPPQTTFQNGLWVNATTGSGDSAAGAPATGEVSIMIFYK